jgi:hypothetical protein
VKLLDRIPGSSGPKVVIVGPPGVGKTSLAKGLPPELRAKTVFIDAEAGTLTIGGLDIACMRPRTWPEIRNAIVAIAGPDPGLPSTAAYSQEHFDAVMADPDMARLADYEVAIFDSVTDYSRRCRVWAEQQPESLTERGRKDLRGTYGLVAREMIAGLQQLQHAREKTIVLIAVLELATDDFGHRDWRIQLEGQATGRQLPAIVDEVITMNFVNFGDNNNPVRSFICSSPNPWGYPAKDRSGRLEQLEQPDLGKLLAKLTSNPASQTSNGD